jgi:cation:H+ antiporter
MLAVVGLACSIAPARGFSDSILYRDIPVMFLLSLSIIAFGLNYSGKNAIGIIGRLKGLVWIASFVAYFVFLAIGEISK